MRKSFSSEWHFRTIKKTPVNIYLVMNAMYYYCYKVIGLKMFLSIISTLIA